MILATLLILLNLEVMLDLVNLVALSLEDLVNMMIWPKLFDMVDMAKMVDLVDLV